MSETETSKPKVTDVHIRQWIKDQKHFGFEHIETNMFLTFPKSHRVPVFKFRYRMGRDKKREIMTIGAYGKITLANARSMAKKFNGQIANGISPKIEIAKRKEEAARNNNIVTMEKLTADYFNAPVVQALKRPNQIKWVLDHINSAMGKMAVPDITRQHIDDMLKNDLKRGKPTSTNKLLEITKRMLDYAIKKQIIVINPATVYDKTDAGGYQDSRTRNLSRSELVMLFKEMSNIDGFTRQNYLAIKLLLLLCVRKCELTQAPKSEFNLEDSVWRLGYDDRVTKTKTPITIPLSKQAISVLKELFELSGDSDYLFPARKSQRQKSPYINDGTLNKALKEHITSLAPFTVHDLRRTGRTKLAELGIDDAIGKGCLNHTLKGVDKVYNHSKDFEKRQHALQTWANFLESCETGTDWNVIPISRQA